MAGIPSAAQGRLAVVTLPAEIDFANASALSAQLTAVLCPGVSAVIADMTATRFCDSAGIRMLILASEYAVAHDSELRLLAPDQAVVRTMTIMGVDKLLSTYPTLDQAVASDPDPCR